MCHDLAGSTGQYEHDCILGRRERQVLIGAGYASTNRINPQLPAFQPSRWRVVDLRQLLRRDPPEHCFNPRLELRGIKRLADEVISAEPETTQCALVLV